MGTTCTLRWRSEQDRELAWTVDPTHPIAQGVPNPIIIDQQEMSGETLDIPTPDERHCDVRRVIANGVVWARTVRPGRAVPTLLRHETDAFPRGHGYRGAITDADG